MGITTNIMCVKVNSSANGISRTTALGFFLTLHLLTSPSSAFQCVKEDYEERILVETGKVYYAKTNKCVLQPSDHWIRSDIVQNSLEREPQFHYHRPSCCCRVNEYVLRTVVIEGTVLKFKQVQSCMCSSCCDLE